MYPEVALHYPFTPTLTLPLQGERTFEIVAKSQALLAMQRARACSAPRSSYVRVAGSDLATTRL